MSLVLTSNAFDHGAPIPSRYTCAGGDISPPLQWQGVPSKARSLALVMDDPDAPDPRAPKMTWVHWVLYNIPPETGALREAATSGNLPPGSAEGINDWHRVCYGGPCPPIGRHRYYIRLYALDTMLEGLQRPTKAQLKAAMAGHCLAEAELMGTFEQAKSG